MSKEQFTMTVKDAIEHLQTLCEDDYLVIKNSKGEWYSFWGCQDTTVVGVSEILMYPEEFKI